MTIDDAYDGLVAVEDNNPDEHAGHHANLKDMCVIDCATEKRIIPNDCVFKLDNECFEGQVMLLVRTPDVDNNRDPCLKNMKETPKRVSQYFKGKKRRFEFQFQVKLKKVPTGALFLGCELEEQIKVGSITRGLVGILLAMVRRINPGFHYAWGPAPDANFDTGEYEKTHLSFPVEASMDRIVITKPGGTPPQLGFELFESNESVKRRRRLGAGSVDWNTEDIYTMCLWSAYVDWMKWKSLNVPGVSPFTLGRVTGTQPIYLSVYEITSCPSSEYKRKRPMHLRKDMKVYTRLEFSNEEKTTGGLAETVCGRGGGGSKKLLSTDSLPDTESVDSDFETTSYVSHVTIT